MLKKRILNYLLRKPFTKEQARQILSLAERIYLLSFGWEELAEDEWDSPLGYPKEHLSIRQGHAVNSQKKWDYEGQRRRR